MPSSSAAPPPCFVRVANERRPTKKEPHGIVVVGGGGGYGVYVLCDGALEQNRVESNIKTKRDEKQQKNKQT